MSEATSDDAVRRGQNLVAGGLLVLVGGLASYISWSGLSLGTIERMGPGMFPLALGILLIALGLAMALPSLRGSFVNPLRSMDMRSFFWISASILLFSATVPFFGLIPAIVLVVVSSSQADGVNRLLTLFLLSAALSIMAFLIFTVGLGIRIPLAIWPW